MARNGVKTGGGSRKGKPNKSKREVKDILERIVDFDVVAAKLYELAQGVTVSEVKNGNVVVYEKPPDVAAAKVLMEYGFGKPAQSIDLTSKGEKILLNVVYEK
jgi:hypothetical protein